MVPRIRNQFIDADVLLDQASLDVKHKFTQLPCSDILPKQFID
jgi:hypothetical protein